MVTGPVGFWPPLDAADPPQDAKTTEAATETNNGRYRPAVLPTLTPCIPAPSWLMAVMRNIS
jgi:small neutral amino acid transporter SnatA (MarC family)